MEEFVHKKIPLKIKKIHPDAVVPSYAHDGDMCFDLTAVSVEYDEKTDSYIYHTGLQMELGYGYGANLVPRSKNVKTECYLANMEGKVDAYGYRGEVKAVYKNRTSWEVRQMLAEWNLMKRATKGLNFSEDEPIGETVRKLRENAKNGKTTMHPMDFAPYKVGDRMCQMEIIKVIQADIIVSDELSEPKRGNGFGSSGD
jgi:dUTP pyrophosphatase